MDVIREVSWMVTPSPDPSTGGGPALVALGLVLLTLLLSLVYHRYIVRPGRIFRRLQAQGVPGYPFRPYLGQLPNIMQSYTERDSDPALAARTSGVQFWTDGCERFGPVWTFAMGRASSVAVSDPDVVRQMYTTHSAKFKKTDFVKQALGHFGNGLIISDREVWQQHRRLINPAFGMREVKRLFPIMGKCASKALQRWAEKISTPSSGKEYSGADADPQPASAKPAPLLMDVELGTLTMDVILRAAFGTHMDRLLGEEEQADLQKALAQHFSSSVLSEQLAFIIPLYGLLPTSLNRTVWHTRKVILDAVHQVVEKRMEELAMLSSTQREARILSAAPSTERAGPRVGGPAAGDPSSETKPTPSELGDAMETTREGIPLKNSAQEETDLLTLMLKATHLPRKDDGANSFTGLPEVTPNGGPWKGDVVDVVGGSDSDVPMLKKKGSAAVSPSGAHRQKGRVDADAPMSMDEVMAQCVTFFGAGSETTSNLLTWTMLLLSQHPEWQEKARVEVMELCRGRGGGWSPSFDELNEMKVVTAVLNETLRLLPPVPAMSNHCCEDVPVSPNLVIPKGCDVYVVIEAIHKNKEFWGPDAEEFHPERFLEGVSKAALRPGVFLPFSMGPRNCIGQNFAMVEAKVLLGAILQKYSWQVAESYVHHPEALVTLKAKHGLPVYLTPLSP